ncbi:MAG: nucleotidyltransferase domain-containing protein [Boseongicola sp. SB0677_bin_26]|nr:nucleotidyltransferase domain-containing protein [Boseongicola sp. SB0665_bin_10]MYG26044.1 nucleotidyltransferase domain-containing protein [Boseongicola sp. SB0677_bin_26]
MDDAAALSEIRRAAQATLDAWPEAKAAVLFGSRARGTHRPDSDWDVAFIVKGDGDRLGTVPADVPFSVPGVRRRHYVNEIAIPERLVARKALCIGHVGRGVAVDGRILAGAWIKPSLRGRPFMEAEKYKGSAQNAFLMVWKACDASAKCSEDWDMALRWVDDFVASTADAAEHLAKAAMGRHGIDAYTIHSLDNLAGQAKRAGLHALAEDVLSMNGATKKDHVVRYEGATKESLAHAIARLPVVIDRMRQELKEFPEGYPDPQARENLAKSAARLFSEGAALLTRAVVRDGADMQPPEPYEWLKPLIEFREELAATLDATADVLRNDRNSSKNDDWQPPEPSPLDDQTDPFKT